MAKKRINSRSKGKNGELEWRDVLLSFGINARRGAQFSGSPDSPDVVADTPGWHAEVKRTECLNLYSAMDQATTDSGPSRIPYVAHRKNKRPWVVITPANAWVSLILIQKMAERLTGVSVQSQGFGALLLALESKISEPPAPTAGTA